MTRLIPSLLIVVVLLSIGLGCGGSPQKGVNKDKDRPKSTEKTE